MRFVDGEESDGHVLQPVESVAARQALRREIEQAAGAVAGLLYDLFLAIDC